MRFHLNSLLITMLPLLFASFIKWRPRWKDLFCNNHPHRSNLSMTQLTLQNLFAKAFGNPWRVSTEITWGKTTTFNWEIPSRWVRILRFSRFEGWDCVMKNTDSRQHTIYKICLLCLHQNTLWLQTFLFYLCMFHFGGEKKKLKREPGSFYPRKKYIFLVKCNLTTVWWVISAQKKILPCTHNFRR